MIFKNGSAKLTHSFIMFKTNLKFYPLYNMGDNSNDILNKKYY